MKNEKILTSDFACRDSEIYAPEELHKLIVEAQGGSSQAKSKILNSMRQWILKMQGRRVYGAVTKQDLYDMSVDSVLDAIDDFDPTAGCTFSSWCVNKMRGQMVCFTSEHKTVAKFTDLDSDDKDTLELASPSTEEAKANKELVRIILNELPERQANTLDLRFGISSGNPMSTDLMTDSQQATHGKRISRTAMSARVKSALLASRSKLPSLKQYL